MNYILAGISVIFLDLLYLVQQQFFGTLDTVAHGATLFELNNY